MNLGDAMVRVMEAVKEHVKVPVLENVKEDVVIHVPITVIEVVKALVLESQSINKVPIIPYLHIKPRGTSQCTNQSKTNEDG